MYRYKVINGKLIVFGNEITFVFSLTRRIEVDVIDSEYERLDRYIT